MDLKTLRELVEICATAGYPDGMPVIVDNVTKYNQIEKARVVDASDVEKMLILTVDPEPFSW